MNVDNRTAHIYKEEEEQTALNAISTPCAAQKAFVQLVLSTHQLFFNILSLPATAQYLFLQSRLAEVIKEQ